MLRTPPEGGDETEVEGDAPRRRARALPELRGSGCSLPEQHVDILSEPTVSGSGSRSRSRSESRSGSESESPGVATTALVLTGARSSVGRVARGPGHLTARIARRDSGETSPPRRLPKASTVAKPAWRSRSTRAVTV